MTKQVYEDLKELEAVYKKLTCSIQQAFNIAKPVIYARWIEHFKRDDYNDDESTWYECNNCHSTTESPYNYCPNCGARMTQKLQEVEKEVT